MLLQGGVSIEDVFIQLLFRRDHYPEPLGMGFTAPDATDHPAWTKWMPSSMDEWAIIAVWLQLIENMQTGFLYRGRRRFDGQVLWLERQDDERSPSWGAREIRAGARADSGERASGRPGLPEEDRVIETLLHYACTAAAEQGILRLAASRPLVLLPDLLSFGFTASQCGVEIATCHDQPDQNSAGRSTSRVPGITPTPHALSWVVHEQLPLQAPDVDLKKQ